MLLLKLLLVAAWLNFPLAIIEGTHRASTMVSG